MKLNKKGLEMKILMTWLFIIIATIVVIFIIATLGSKSADIASMLGDIF